MLLERLNNLKEKIILAFSILQIEELKEKTEKLLKKINQSDFWTKQKQAQVISTEYEDLRKEIEKWENLLKETEELIELTKISETNLQEELEQQVIILEKKYFEYEFYLLLSNPYDQNSAIVEIHAGSGGTEAQDWAEMLKRMIFRFAEKMNWTINILNESIGAEAGIKSITFQVKGRYAYGYLKSEHGTHRLVRISPFDAEKMRHTSFALIEILPESEQKISLLIKPEDLRIDTFMSGGHGGQSVNTTYSAVRIVHIPTNISVSCQNERSQQQNKEMALKILEAKLYQLEQEKLAQEKNEIRGEYKPAEWGNQIRSYVLHPYHLVKDHRTNYESTNPEEVLEGNLFPLSEAYLKWLKK